MTYSYLILVIILIILLFYRHPLYKNINIQNTTKNSNINYKVNKIITILKEVREKFYLTTKCSQMEIRKKHYSRLLELNNTNQLLYKRKSKSADDQNNMVIGLSYGYDRDKLFIFVISLKKCLYRGIILLFVNENIDLKTKTFLEENKVTLIYINDKWPYYSNSNLKYPMKKRTLKEKVPKKIITGKYRFAIIRYFLLNAFLKEYGNAKLRYLFVDVKDVFFQFSPFNFEMPRGVIISEEPRIHKIIENQYNVRYVRTIMNLNEKLNNSYIYNGGCIFFSYPEIVPLLDSMIELIVESKNNDANDQGALIVSLIYKPKENYYFMTNGFGPVRNIGTELWEMMDIVKHNEFKINEIFQIKDKKIINYDCTVPVLIHMYTQFKTKELYDFIMEILSS